MSSTRSFDQLLGSALDLIAESGIDALTLSQVAGRADVSRATAYREFGDKDGLIGAVAQHEIGLMLAAVLTEIDPSADSAALVESIIVSALHYLRGHAAFTYVRNHEPHWLLQAVLAVGDSRMNLVQTVASIVAPTIAVDAARLRLPALQAAEVMVRTVLSHTLIERSSLTDEQVAAAVAHAILAD